MITEKDVREAMQKQEMSQLVLAHKAGIATGTLSDWLSGRREATDRTKLKVAVALGLEDPSVLMDGEPVAPTATDGSDEEQKEAMPRGFGKLLVRLARIRGVALLPTEDGVQVTIPRELLTSSDTWILDGVQWARQGREAQYLNYGQYLAILTQLYKEEVGAK